MRNALLFQCLLDLGPRVQELLNAKIRDFNPFQATIFIRALKGSRDREIPMAIGLARAVRKFVLDWFGVKDWHLLDPDAKIFNLSYDRAYQIWQFYTPNKEKTMHCLRHTFATNLYRKTKDIKLVQIALGHKNILNTQVYVDFVYAQDSMRALMYGNG
ncbi:hypothetical protein AZI87_11955 [Bdellovibrio bacteriovorus]|uniref:Tyr recombinase domain-containing protein n=1 Tax=Bdellovibrio bacteriovorus TaxID=959 RepID=A0A162G8A2_BDEBC|nr:site-specific integrase [Bdellovibrio bacteriovorus]KYG65262.1 hypothetical protein AZI87_11955 [Bdellovibrio bacteriovorus]